MTSVLSALLSRSWRALLIPIVVILGPTSAGVAAAQSGTWISNGPEGGNDQRPSDRPQDPEHPLRGDVRRGRVPEPRRGRQLAGHQHRADYPVYQRPSDRPPDPEHPLYRDKRSG